VELTNSKEQDKIGFEPSAGNGLLTIAGDPKTFYVNEIDKTRNRNLLTQNYLSVLKIDATKDFSTVPELHRKQFDAVITNPPFGRISHTEKFDGYPINSLEQLMAIRGLEP